MDSKPRPPVVWFHFQECTCCSESFLRSSHPLVADILLDQISLDYTETLQAAAGKQAEEALHNTMKKYRGQYLMLVEGAVPVADGGIYCCIGGRTALDIVTEAAAGAKAIMCWGSCASNGCIQAAKPQSDRLHSDSQGDFRYAHRQCPGLSADRRRNGGHDRLPAGVRPPAATGPTRPAQGILLPPGPRQLLPASELRRGPVRRGMGRRKRQAGLLPIQDGVPRSGHVQRLRHHPLEQRRQLSDSIGARVHRLQRGEFWDNGPFYRHLPSFPGFGIETTADKVGLAIGAATAAGIAAHAVLTNIRKHKLIGQEIEESEPPASSNEGGT